MLRLRFSALAVGLATAAVLVAPVARGDTVDTCISAAEEGQRLQRQTKLGAARDRFLVCAKESCPASLAADCKRWLKEVDEASSSVVIRALDGSGKELTNVKVVVDGRELSSQLDGKPIDVDPGPRAFQYEAGGQKVDANVVIRQGERNRLLDVRFEHLNGPTGPEGPKVEGRSIPTVAWVLGVSGLVVGATGAVFWIIGKGQHDDLFETCGKTRACTESDKSGPQTLLLVGDIAIATGVVALAAAVGITIFSKPTRVAPAFMPGGGGVLTASGTF